MPPLNHHFLIEGPGGINQVKQAGAYYSKLPIYSPIIGSIDGNLSLTAPNGSVSLLAGGSDVMDITSLGVTINGPYGFQLKAGAANGKVLTSDAQGNASWQTASSGTASPLTTKGDLYTYSTANARLGIGTDGQILIADSTQATGLKWGAAPATGVTAVSVASTNGFAGTSSGGSTPSLTLSTSVVGILQGNGTAISAATTTGTGNVVLSASPALTGTPTAPTQALTDNSTNIATTAFAKSLAGTQSLVANEVPGGTIDGTNKVFTLASTPATNSLTLHKNGIRLKGGGADYTLAGNTITFVTAPPVSAVLLADYNISNTAYSVGTNSRINDEVPTGAVNGTNTSFTAARAYIGGSLSVYVNGLKLQNGVHFTETTPSTGAFTISDAPLTGDVVTIVYDYNLNPSSNADTVDGIHANTTATANQLMPLDGNAKVNAGLFYNPYKFNAILNSAQNTVNGWTQVTLNAVRFDTNSNFNTTTTYQYTAPVAGFYQFNYSAVVNLTGASTLAASLSKNGTGNRLWQGTEVANAGAGYASVGGSNLVQLAAGDTVQMNLYCSISGCAIGAGDGTTFQGFLVSTL